MAEPKETTGGMKRIRPDAVESRSLGPSPTPPGGPCRCRLPGLALGCLLLLPLLPARRGGECSAGNRDQYPRPSARQADTPTNVGCRPTSQTQEAEADSVSSSVRSLVVLGLSLCRSSGFGKSALTFLLGCARLAVSLKGTTTPTGAGTSRWASRSNEKVVSNDPDGFYAAA